ncbi:hypothetical protein [Tautonia plasticadhaerens]|uniref:Uncharacterized protein n=1 Tax=Tautonia plasticadhaerens TaxID=2527974 RepID=A0A518HB75_9BACT|nr:hypothetical protein [Tautonia plasticadhaerens]QDV38112.1 hypothetical protein ElP_60610 [Tautonia plasticadhaerens]
MPLLPLLLTLWLGGPGQAVDRPQVSAPVAAAEPAASCHPTTSRLGIAPDTLRPEALAAFSEGEGSEDGLDGAVGTRADRHPGRPTDDRSPSRRPPLARRRYPDRSASLRC